MFPEIVVTSKVMILPGGSDSQLISPTSKTGLVKGLVSIITTIPLG